MMPKRKALILNDQALTLLPRLAGKYHQQGEYVSRLIIAAAERQTEAAPALLAQLSELEQQIIRLREQLQQAG